MEDTNILSEPAQEMTDYHYFVNRNRINTNTSIYYANFFFNDAKNGKKIIWNWWAFLFGPFWCLSRKLYTGVVVYTIIFLITTNPQLTSVYSQGLGAYGQLHG
jgi:hypothetical protein